MDSAEAKEKIQLLREQIAFHEKLYRVKNAPQISDNQFDTLMHELRALEDEFPQFYDPNSPSVRVGNDLSESFESVEHLSPMLSLDNVFDSAELEEFDARLKKVLETDADLRYCVEPKIDGAGISAVYENGRLVRLLTRGNGAKGDDITRNSFVVKNLPATLLGTNIPSLLEIRGEAYMERSEFLRISEVQREELTKKTLDKKLKELQKTDKSATYENVKLLPEELAAIEKKLPANPRNLTAGTLKLLDTAVLRSRSLMAIFYSVGAIEGVEIAEQHELPKILKSWGLPSVNWFALADGAHGAFEKICELEEIRAEFPFDTDGAVVKLDDCALHEKAGMTSHAPRWAIAWKYRAERAETRLNGITIQVGRTGAITPVAELEPIKRLSGTEVHRATLHNENYIVSKDIRIGDTVLVEKAGEIIPAVLGVVLEKRSPDAQAFVFPTHCPECGAQLRKLGEISRCPNMACPPQIRGRLEHFASRNCMDIRGLGEKVVAELTDKLDVRDPSDIYTLTRDKLLEIGKFKDKSADNLMKSIEESKSRELWRLIFGLGILEIGEQFAKELAAKFGSLDALMNADIEEIKSVEGMGSKSPKKKKSAENEEIAQPVRALSVRAFFDDEHNRGMIERLRAAGLNFEAHTKTVEGTPFSGKLFVITGKLESMGRDDAKKLIEKFGGKTASSVSAKTDYLISAEEHSSKMDAAKKFGTSILAESDFLKMLSEAEQAENAEQTPIEAPQSKEPAPKTGSGQPPDATEEQKKPADAPEESAKCKPRDDGAKFDDGGQGLLGF